MGCCCCCCCCAKMHNACKKFKKKCLTVDGGRPSSSFYPSNIPSFFKIMIGDFAEAMVIPPKFARTLQGMANENIYLEDSNSNCWMVKLSTTDGSLAFKEGWQDFVLDHSISLGEIVIFKHISTSLFSIQVYGTSGSERLQFQGKENSNDRGRKQRMNENLPDILRLSEAQKSYGDSEKFDCQEKENSNIRKGKRKKKENSYEILCFSEAQKRYEAKGKHCDYDKDSLMKCKVEKSAPCDLDSKKMATWDSPIVLSDDDEDANMMKCKKIRLSASKHVKNGKGMIAADNRSSDNCLLTTKRKSSMAHKHAVQNDEEVVAIIPTNSVNHEMFQNKKNPDDINISMANERNVAQHEKVMAVDHKEHVKNGKGTMAADNRSSNNCFRTTKRKSSIAHEHAVQNDEEVVKIIPTNSVNHETLQNKKNPEDTSISMANVAQHEKVMAVDQVKHKEHVKNGKGRVAADNRSSDNCLRTTKRKSSMARKHAVKNDEEVVKIIPTNSVNHEIFQNKKNPEDAKISMANERNVAQQEKVTAVDHVENKEGDAEECNIVHATEKEKEVTQITPANLPQPETVQTTKRSIFNDTKALDVKEELFHGHNSLEILKPISAADCTEHEIKIHNEAPQVQNAAMKDLIGNGKISSDSRSKPEKFLNKLDALVIVGHNYDRSECATPNYIEEGDRDLTISEGFARKSLSYAADEDSKKKLEASRDASISAIEGDCNILCVDALGVAKKSLFPSETGPEMPSDTPILNCDLQNPLPSPSKENLENYGDPSEAKPKPVESNRAIMEVQPFQYGAVSNEFPDVNAEKVTPCSKEVLRAVKTEILDSAPTIAPNDAKFSATITLNSQSWLLLPKKLPACLFRRKCLKSVVLLQDASMKLWPVLYNDGPNFIGFVGGWEDFTIANNLRQGNTCRIESIDAFEPTLKVQLSNVQNLVSLA